MGISLTKALLAGEIAAFSAANAYFINRMRRSHQDFGRHAAGAYNFNTVLFPLVLSATAALGYREAQRTRDRSTASHAALGGLAAVGCAAARVYATHIEPRLLHVHHIRIPTPKVRHRLRILHLSDMETDAVRNQEPKVIGVARHLSADLVVHTGDLLNPIEPATYESELPKMARVWDELWAPLGKWNVAGEVDLPIIHELRRGIGGLRQLEGVRVLRHRSTKISVLGLTFEQSCNEEPEQLKQLVRNWLVSSDPDAFTLLLGHRPDYILSVQDQAIDLCLAGHTHGGQVVVPGYGPIKTMSEVPKQWASGFHQVGATRLNVSAGVGFEHNGGVPAIRVNCPPEMTVFDLVPVHRHADSV
jgi:predicted MPP superfamily phosphohydrolase